MTTPTDREWRTLLGQLETPAVGQVAEALADARDLDVGAAFDTVETAIADGLLVEEDTGGSFPAVTIAEEAKTAEMPKSAVNQGRGGRSSGREPRGKDAETDLADRQSAVEALRDVLRFYARHVDDTIADHTEEGEHPDRPDTAREYFTDVRGWADHTVDELLLGWAPPGHVDELVAFLHDRGHTREAILATGAVGESDRGGFYSTFNARYVLAYYDAEGAPAYAIARTTGGVGGGAKGYGGHPADYQAGKYAKLRHTDDRVPFSEPIYGLDTLAEGDHVVIAEGIADAITARELGYAVLSPVAKEFKRTHYAPLAEALAAHDVDRVTIVADADGIRNGDAEGLDPDTIGDAVAGALSPVGAGLGGALRTATKLGARTEAAIRVAVPPAPGDLTNDLDEFVTGPWRGSLGAILASAKPARAFVAYDAAVSRSVETRDVEREYTEPAGVSSESGTALWDLDLYDLEGLKDGDRGKNPFAHTGTSEAYFVARRGDGGDVIATDWKAAGNSQTYNALTALLVEAGERHRDRPEGSLSDAEVFHAWRQAKLRGDLVDDDPVPYRALLGIAVEDGLVDRGDLILRDADGGDVVEDRKDADESYKALPPGTYDDVLGHVEETYGVDVGRDRSASFQDDEEPDREAGRDLLGLDVVVEPANALAAAAAVTPEDLDRDLPELDREDVEDVAIAVALAEGWINTPETWPDDGRYTAAYYLARDRYGAPLPKYLDNSTLEERTTLVFAALDRVRPRHILDALESEITVEDPHGAGTAKINPTWEDSESGERIVAGYGRGFWCAEHSPDRPDGSRTFDPLQVVALEAGLVEDEFTRPTGGAFKESYRLLREEYGAPLPRWRATLLETVPVLPPAVRLLDDVSATEADVETLGDARRRTEALVREAVDETNYAQLLTCLPGTGKTYGAIATAADRPMLYVTGRNELKKQAETYAATIRDDVEAHPEAQPSVAHLPVLSETRLPEDAVREGLDAVREGGFDLLRDEAAALWDRVAPHLDAEADEEDEETVDLARGTCETAEGDHGDRWRVRVMLANALGLRPADIHRADRALFGEALPCQTDADGEACECGLTEAWDRIRDPDRPLDLLVGSPQHAHVDSATTHYSRDADGDRVERPRAVVIDEFPEEAFFASYGGRYMDHATWLAEALVDVDTREDLLAADLSGDAWVDLWLDGEGGEYALAGDAIAALSAAGDLVEAVETAETIIDEGRLDPAAEAMADTEDDNATLLDHWDDWRPLRETLAAVADASPDEDVTAAVDVLDMAEDALRTEAGRAYAETKQDDTDGEDRVDAAAVMYRLADDLETVLDGLNPALDLVDGGEAGLVETVAHRVDALPVGGDLRGLLDAAVEAIRGDAPDGLLDAATTALRGGRDGCRELALFARGGYAHPDAWAHLAGAIADTEDDDVREVVAEAFSFDPEVEGGRYKRTTRNGAQLLADKNHHGEVVVDPPAFCDAIGSTCPVVGLDATGRSALWRVAIGRDTHRLDIHDTDAERRRFLADTVDLSVVQTAETPLPYHGDPTTKNFTEDVALVEEVAAKYTGDGDDALDTKGPAVMSTQKVLGAIAEELDPHAGATVEYESMKGSDALGDRQVAVLLGSQHYGDGAPEMWGLVAGESPGRDGTKGSGLDYGTDVANAFLRYMREDHVMQGILRAGRNDETTVVFAHTSALRDDLPVEARGALVSAHSKGTLQVVEAAAAFGGRFTAPDVADAIAGDGVGLRQVQNVLSDLRESGYVEVRESGDRGRAYGYGDVEDPGKAEVSLPEVAATDENEISAMNSYSWDFVLDDPDANRHGPPPTERPTIPASTAATPAASGAGPPG